MDRKAGSNTRHPWLFRLITPPLKAALWLMNRALRMSSADPSFFDNTTMPWVAEVESRFPGVREECLRLVADLNRIPNLDEIAEGSRDLARGTDWKAVLLLVCGLPVEANVRRCPKTWEALQQIPGVTSALFSILAPGVHLKRHTGPFAGVLRLHLGVIVPPGDRCRISVDDEIRTWEAGKVIIFDDTHPHEVWNETEQIRVVLFVDFVRPMPAPFRLAVHALFALARMTPFIKDHVRNAEAMAQAASARATTA